MKRLCPSYEMVFNRLMLLVRKQRAVFVRNLFFNLFKTFFHYRGGNGSVFIMKGHLIQSTMNEFAFNGRGLRIGQGSPRGRDLDDAQIGLVAGDRDGEIQGFFSRPGNQFFRRVSPVHTKRRLQKLLSVKRGGDKQHAGEKSNSFFHDTFDAVTKDEHGSSLACLNPLRKPRRMQPGMVLIEATMAVGLLTVVGLILFTLTMNVITPRQYALQQVLSDSYLTFERAQAQRIPFETLVTEDETPWPIFPEVATEEIEIGKLPGGRSVEGTVIRTRYPDDTNYPMSGGTGTEVTNPAAMEIWRVQSVLRYSIADRTYVKSRIVIRAQ